MPRQSLCHRAGFFSLEPHERNCRG
jgi:hypothetical protein